MQPRGGLETGQQRVCSITAGGDDFGQRVSPQAKRRGHADVGENGARLPRSRSFSHARELRSAVGGENISTIVKGQERYPVNVRYMRDFRSDLDSLNKIGRAHV